MPPESPHAVLAAELERASVSGEPPALDRASFNQWGGACHELWEAGRIEDDRIRGTLLSEPKIPEQPLSSYSGRVFRCHAAPSACAACFSCDAPTAEIKIGATAGLEKLVLCCCRCQWISGLPLNFIHRWLGRLPASLVYIKDFRNLRGGCRFPTLFVLIERPPSRLGAWFSMPRHAKSTRLGVSLGGYPVSITGWNLALLRSAQSGRGQRIHALRCEVWGVRRTIGVSTRTSSPIMRSVPQRWQTHLADQAASRPRINGLWDETATAWLRQAETDCPFAQRGICSRRLRPA